MLRAEAEPIGTGRQGLRGLLVTHDYRDIVENLTQPTTLGRSPVDLFDQPPLLGGEFGKSLLIALDDVIGLLSCASHG